MTRQGQVAVSGQIGWMHPTNYGVHQFIDAFQNGQAIQTPLGPLGALKIITFSGGGSPT